MSAKVFGAEAHSAESSQERLERLGELEIIVDQGMDTFVEVGSALMEIRDSRLYRELHPTFEEYCLERWGFTASRARQMIAAVKTVTDVTAEGLHAPKTEGAARRLARERRAAAITDEALHEWLAPGAHASEPTANGRVDPGAVPAETALANSKDKALHEWRKSAERHLDTTADLLVILEATGPAALASWEQDEIVAYAKRLGSGVVDLLDMLCEDDG